MKRVQEVMSRDGATLEERDPLRRAEELLKSHHTRHLPVIKGGRLIGLLTNRDLLATLARGGKLDTRVGAAMTTDVVTVLPETPLQLALHKMLEAHYGCLPVVDAKGRLLGLVTDADLVRYCGELLEAEDLREDAAEYRA